MSRGSTHTVKAERETKADRSFEMICQRNATEEMLLFVQNQIRDEHPIYKIGALVYDITGAYLDDLKRIIVMYQLREEQHPSTTKKKRKSMITPDPAIQQELLLVDNDHPQYLEQFLQHMEAGETVGNAWRKDNSCGCFYGWLAELDTVTAVNTQEHYSSLLDHSVMKHDCTPIEWLIVSVKAGQTPETSLDLLRLKYEILFFLEQKQTRVEALL